MRVWILIVCYLLIALPAHAFERRTPVVQAVEKTGPAVVNIRTEQVVQRRSSPFGFADPFFDDFFRSLAPPRVYKTQSLGSGVIVDPRGYLLTNAHVIDKASKIFVALPDRKQEVEAKLVGAESRLDLAVLKLEGEKSWPHLPLSTSTDLLLGETVIAIGNPLGLGHSITTGVVSSANRRLSLGEGSVSHFIQTDALINPGNSGGPLLNINGELIGINTAIARQAQGIGFSIPSEVAGRVLDELIAHGRVRPAYHGIFPGKVSRTLVHARGEGGVLVTEVESGSPAAAAGLQTADVILGVDGLAVESPEEFLNLLATYPPGSRLRFGILRGTGEREISLRLAALPQGYALRYGERTFGLRLAETPNGLAVTSIVTGSPAARAGIRPGDLVAELDGERIGGINDYVQALERRLGRVPVSFLVVRGSRGYYVDLP